jgi:hypothetical protein
MSQPYNPITGDDLRKTVIWISEQLADQPAIGSMDRGDTPICADCGHGLRHHIQDRSLRSCTFPRGLGAPKALCNCLDFLQGSDDDE